MAIFPLALTLLAAFLHAFWNLLARGTPDRELVIQWGLWASVILFFPVLLISGPLLTAPPLVPVLASALFEIAYLILLLGAYRSGKLSIVYPLARGTSPVIVTLASVFYFGRHISLIGCLGIITILSGVILLCLPKLGRSRKLAPPSYDLRSSVMAVSAGGCIAGYTLVDSFAVALTNPLPYKYCVFILMALGLTFFNCTYRGRKSLSLSAIRFKPVIVIGIFSFLAYLIVLYAMRLAPVAYVATLRETSILFAVFLGWLVLKETLGVKHLVGIGIILIGIVLLKLS